MDVSCSLSSFFFDDGIKEFSRLFKRDEGNKKFFRVMNPVMVLFVGSSDWWTDAAWNWWKRQR
jgi:hypothetical protein